MTPATIQTLPDGTRQGVCVFCSQIIGDHDPYVEPLPRPEDETRFILRHNIVGGS